MLRQSPGGAQHSLTPGTMQLAHMQTLAAIHYCAGCASTPVLCTEHVVRAARGPCWQASLVCAPMRRLVDAASVCCCPGMAHDSMWSSQLQLTLR
jgi:hypothetical protein